MGLKESGGSKLRMSKQKWELCCNCDVYGFTFAQSITPQV